MATLNIRNIDDQAAMRIKAAAAARGWTMGQYIAHLVEVHDIARQRADAGDDQMAAELMAIGMGTVRT